MKILNSLKYQLRIYFRGSSFIMPIVLSAIFMYVMYSIAPVYVVSSFLLSGLFLFYVMVWIGLAIAQNEKTEEEQLLFLRMGNAFSYYSGKFLVLGCISLLLVAFYTLYPVLVNVLNGYGLFIRKLEVYDVLNAFVLQLGVALLGASAGNFLHPRIMRDRKLAVIITVLISIIALLASILEQQWEWLKWILWIFPPVFLPFEVYGNETVYQFNQTMMIFGSMLVYVAVYTFVKSYFCNKRGW